MSAHGIFRVPEPYNEPVKGYEPGSPERDELRHRLDELSGQRLEIPLVIGGEDVQTGDTFEAVMPHKRSHVLANVQKGGAAEVDRAITAAADAWEDWSRTPWEDRAAVLLRAAELLAGPWRQTLNAATMLNQSKTDRKSTRLNSSHMSISYAVFCLKKKKKENKSLIQTTIEQDAGH